MPQVDGGAGLGGYTPSIGLLANNALAPSSNSYNPANVDGGAGGSYTATTPITSGLLAQPTPTPSNNNLASVPSAGFQTNPDAGAPIPAVDPTINSTVAPAVTPSTAVAPTPAPVDTPAVAGTPIAATTPNPVTTPVVTPTPAPVIAAPSSVIPVPNSPVPPAPYAMPTAPNPVDASVAHQMDGLLRSDSPYMALARSAGERTAHRRGLQNSSIAAGSSEAAAIAAAAPIASQDASQLHQTNQSNLESYNQLRNATAVEQMSENAAMWRQMDSNVQQILLNNSSNAAGMERLLKQGDIESAIALMNADKSLTQTQINANVSLLSNYMSAFSALAQNDKIPAAARDAYIANFQRVTAGGQSLVNALSGIKVTLPSAGSGLTSSGNGSGVTETSTAKVAWTGPTPDQIMAMFSDGQKGGYGYPSSQAALDAYNKWAAANGVALLTAPASPAKKGISPLISPLGALLSGHG